MATTVNPVDPYQLLKALSSLLSNEGGIKSVNEVSKVVVLMKSARKMVSRCMYMNILQSTSDKETRERFIQEGGWELLNTWLQEAKTGDHSPVITELIKVFERLPVTIEILKKNNTAKIIKSISKGDGEEKLKTQADNLVTAWMAVIKTSNIEKDKDKPSTVKKKKKVKKPEKHASSIDRNSNSVDGEDADDESEEPVSKKIKLDSANSEPMDTGDDAHRTSGDSKSKQATEKSGKHAKTALKSYPTRSKAHLEAAKREAEAKEDNVAAKTKKPAKVVRPAHTKFRSTGLEKDSELPLPKVKKKPPVQPLVKTEKPKPPVTVKKDGPLFSKSLSPTEKKPPKPPELSRSPSASHGKIKLIPAKPKLQESSGFLDALNAPTLALKKKVPKKIVARTNSTGSNKAKSPTPAEEIKPEPPKFSFYSSNQPVEEEKKADEKKDDGATEPKEDGDNDAEDWKEDRPIAAGKSNLKFGPSKSKKAVKWKDDMELVDVYYFVLDETERVNVNKVKDFQDAMHNEKLMEKQAIMNAMKQGKTGLEDDKTNGNSTIEFFAWRRPLRMDVTTSMLTETGTKSEEKITQAKREQLVLQEIFFDQKNLPLTPKEPDPETKRAEQTRKIPLEDEASAEAGPEPLFQDYQNFGQFGAPHHPGAGVLGSPPGRHPGGGMGHGVGHVMGPMGGGPPGGHPGGSPRGHGPPGPHAGGPPSGLLGNHPGASPRGPGGRTDTTPPSPNTTIRNVQNLLASLSDGDANTPGGDLLSQKDLTDKLKEMLEPFKNQIPGNQDSRGGGSGGGGSGGNVPYRDGPPGNFGPGGPHEPRGPFPMGPDGPMHHEGPMGRGSRPGGPGGPGPRPHFNGPMMGNNPFGPQFSGPNFPGPGRGMGMPGRGRGPPERGMGPQGPWRGGRGRGGRGRQVCRHFHTEYGCVRGDACYFLHPTGKGPP